jgi:radical SAM protein with 4Fe4S-binding SPASM domain
VKRFKKVYIEITNVCNLACSFCPPTLRKPEFMELEMFSWILQTIKPYTDLIYFHVKGEPLLHPKIDKFLDLSSEYGLQVNLTTNGTLIHKTRDKIMSKSALRQVNISLHSLEGNIGMKMDEYLRDIFSFIKIATRETNIIISLRLWNLEESTINQEKQVNSEIFTKIQEEFQLPFEIYEQGIQNSGLKIAHRVYLNQDRRFQWPGLKEKVFSNQGFCHGLRNQVAILVDGTVVPCCLDGEGVINLGNINNTSFSEIIESERAKNLYQGFSRRNVVEELCQKCGYRNRFGV